MPNTPILLTELVGNLLVDTTEIKPIHWTVLTQKFVESSAYTNDELVTAVNSLLVPFGGIRGSNHNFWYEPLAEQN